MDILRFAGRDKSSKDIAKERLKLVLIHDRANVSPRFLDMIKTDIIKVLSNYIEIKESDLDIRLTRVSEEENDDNYKSALVANIPIKDIKINLRNQ